MHRGTRCLQKVEVCQPVECWVCQKERLQQCLGVVGGYVVGVQLCFLEVAASNNASFQSALKLLFVGYKFAAEIWFVTFEDNRTTKDTEVGNAGLALEAVLIGCCWIAILFKTFLGRADIDDVDSMGMGMMKEYAAKSCVIEENVGAVVDFTPFGFAYTVHFLMFRSGRVNFIPRDVHLEMNLVEVKAAPVSVRMKRTDWLRPRSSVSVSHCVRAMMMEVVLSVLRPIKPVSLPGAVTMNR
jgi:hypothetical protein